MKKISRELLSIGAYLLFILAVTYLVINFVGQRVVVDGQSMETTLSDGDNLIVDKLSYRFSDPERFDIIVFPYEENVYYIKRIIGMPGETVQIDTSGNIYIDGEILEENYGSEIIRPETVGIASEPIVLGEDEYFVLGDNRNHSSDSRNPLVGNIKREQIVGKTWVRIWPLDEFKVLKHQ